MDKDSVETLPNFIFFVFVNLMNTLFFNFEYITYFTIRIRLLSIISKCD